ncbi:MAG: peptidase M75, partial [Muribaculaceae bacterium]|nr:peptidase M75 [Muribaculaceae bacterium]
MIKLKHSILPFALLALCACSDNNEPKPDTDDIVEAATIDYNASNAASWGNYMVQVANLLSRDAAELYDSWTVSYEGGQPFATVFKTHNGGDYSSALSCIEQIVDGCSDIANEVGTSKIGEPYNFWTAGQTEKALYAVESWYSWHSRE